MEYYFPQLRYIFTQLSLWMFLLQIGIFWICRKFRNIRHPYLRILGTFSTRTIRHFSNSGFRSLTYLSYTSNIFIVALLAGSMSRWSFMNHTATIRIVPISGCLSKQQIVTFNFFYLKPIVLSYVSSISILFYWTIDISLTFSYVSFRYSRVKWVKVLVVHWSLRCICI